jgi:hypothetical protein
MLNDSESDPVSYNITYDCVGTVYGEMISEATSTAFPIVATVAVGLPTNIPAWQNLTASKVEIIATAPFFDTVLHSLYPDWPLCTGTMDGFPQPKVVVEALTTTSAYPEQSQSQAITPQPISLSNPGGSSPTISPSPANPSYGTSVSSTTVSQLQTNLHQCLFRL